MKSNTSWLLRRMLLAFVMLNAMVLFGCGPAASTPAPAPTAPNIAPAAPTPAAQAQPGAQAQPTTAPAADTPKKGGSLVMRWFTGDPPDLDPYLNTSFRSQEFGGMIYSRLLKFKSAPGLHPNSFIPEPDLAEDMPKVSADGLTYTFKIRANAKWHNKAPMNGRKVTAQDVVWSWDRFQKVGVQKAVMSMVDSVKAVDDTTVEFKLKEVFAPFETTVATPLFFIMPKEVIEADGDGRKNPVGSGPWMFDKFEKGVQIIIKRNPDYYTEPAYVDEVVLLIVPDDAPAVASFRAKQIDILGVSVSDRISLEKTNPELKWTEYTQNQIWFLYWRLNSKPFSDVKVRQAISMAIDRDEFRKVLYDGKGATNSHLPAGLASWWLDPTKSEFGPNGKYFKRDVDAAKKLLAEAGYPNGLKVPYVSTLNAYGNTFNQSVELIAKNLKEAGIETDLKPQDYAAYIATTFLGKFDEGTMVWGLETPVQEAHDYFYNAYHPKSARNRTGVNDETLTAMIEKQVKTLDKAERKKQIDEIQRYLGEKQYQVMGATGVTNIAIHPWVKNFNFVSDYGRAASYLTKVWLDGKPK